MSEQEANDHNENDMINLKKIRKTQKAQLTRLCKYCLSPNVEIDEVKSRRERAHELLKCYETIQNQIDVEIDDNDEQDVQQQYRDEIEELVLKIDTVYYKLLRESTPTQIQEISQNQSHAQDNSQLSQAVQSLMQHQSSMSLIMERLINNVPNYNSSTPQNNGMYQESAEPRPLQHELKLPRVQLPDFDGNLLEWTRFKELFEAFMHNRTTLPDVEKLEFLHTKLKGEALSIIKHLKPMNANYQIAWELLKKKYDNVDKIKNAYMELLFSLPVMKTSSIGETKRFFNSINEGFNALRAMDQTVDQWNTVLLYTIEKKLDNNTASLWFRDKTQKESTTFTEFLAFLEKRIIELECMQSIQHYNTSTKEQHRRVHSQTCTATMLVCPICTQNHLLYLCDDFKKLTVNQRREVVKKNNLCFNCLRANHKSSECKSSSCKKCDKKHSTLLHIMPPFTSDNCSTLNTNQQNMFPTTVNQPPTNQVNPSEHPTTSNNTNQTSTYVTFNHLQKGKRSYILLPTAIVGIVDSNGSIHQCRALLDSGSQGSLITESCVQRLSLKRVYDKTTIYGLGNEKGTYTKGKVILNICPLNQSKIQITTNALCLSKLTQWLPSASINKENLDYFTNLQLADPHYSTPAPIDVILGAEVFIQCCLMEKVVHPSGTPTALSTIFGWVLMGQVQCVHDDTIYTHFVSTNLDEQLQRFWDLENISTITKQFCPEDEQAEEYFIKTTRRNDEGRYIVRLPLKNEKLNIGESKINALRRFCALENKFKSNHEFEVKYKEFMEEYLQLKHMEVIKQIPVEKPICYLPHHAVLKPCSTTSKLRVVFDASTKTSNGKSLNDNLLTGPKIQNDIFDILINFRKFEIACVADIEKMYRQILVHNEDKLMQCVLWRNNQQDEIKTYSLNTVTYGMASAPFLAIRTLNQISNEHAKSHPTISKIIKTNFYVDDLIYCNETIQEAINITQELSTVLAQSGFHLRKWASNSSEFLNNIQTNDKADQFDSKPQSSTTFTLGLLWNTVEDYFQYSTNTYSTKQISKRSVISDIAKLYDPMGWISPIIINMKIFMQSLWLAGVNWDEQLPEQLLNQWTRLRHYINDITKVKVQRWLKLSNKDQIELHGFSDASEQAYAAAVYLRIKKKNNEIVTHLIAAKTRVTPIKQISLPRLELCAAHLLVKLMSKIRKNFPNTEINMHGWTDSTVVLSWISDHPCKWKTFVANRTSEIINVIPSKQWHHIQSKHNPADVATRGSNPTALIDNYLWWHGPEELNLNQYPTKNQNVLTNIDKKKSKTVIVNTMIHQTSNLISRYSSFTKLLRTVAFIKRFTYNCKTKKDTRRIGFLTAQELKDTEMSLLRLVQQDSFNNEIKIILSGNQLSTKHNLSSVAPFIDKSGILRVGGRIDNANISFDQKHPIILHNQHHFTELIVRYYHLKHCHANKRLLFYIIHLKYWIPSALKVIKKCIYTCTTCIRFKGQTLQTQMGNLPKLRLVPAPTFSNVGIDFAGPTQIISWKGRGNKIYKVWIAIFVCLVTKAIHIELVSELSTAAFIAALRRFISRRGIPNHIHSDNGTNFKGASQHLKELYKFLNNTSNQDHINKYLSDHQIQWHFSPPAAPHFGGLWEAGVKSIKFHLKRVLKDAHPTFEEMLTILCQVEGCLNSRPLCTKYEGDIDPLTPAHFILLRPMVTLPDENCFTVKENYCNRWQYVQRLVQQFWRKWSQEYLHQMQQRAKWHKRTTNIIENDIVLIKDEQLAPSNWLIGKVTELHRGTDGLARVATIKTATGQLKRAIVKLCPLLPKT